MSHTPFKFYQPIHIHEHPVSYPNVLQNLINNKYSYPLFITVIQHQDECLAYGSYWIFRLQNT